MKCPKVFTFILPFVHGFLTACGGGYYGSRSAYRKDKTSFVTLGEQQKGSPAQDLAKTLGKVIRINGDGIIPMDKPFCGDIRPEIWSYRHRNLQGTAIHPDEDQMAGFICLMTVQN